MEQAPPSTALSGKLSKDLFLFYTASLVLAILSAWKNNKKKIMGRNRIYL